MANYTKTVDTNHLVTIGYEGFWGEYDADVTYNPGNGWAGITGQNFTQNIGHDEIDFAEIHYWPDEWFADVSPQLYDCNVCVCPFHCYVSYSEHSDSASCHFAYWQWC